MSAERVPFSYSGLNPLEPAPQPELVFGIVASIGAEREKLVTGLTDELREYGYTCVYIKLSKLIRLIPSLKNHKAFEEKEPERINGLMDLGNQVRKDSGLNGALALLAISEIRESRRKILRDQIAGPADASTVEVEAQFEERLEPSSSDDEKTPQKVAYILDSLKHPDEIKNLRAVYGAGFTLISGYSRRSKRLDNLVSKISKSRADPHGDEGFRADAEKLIQRDYSDGGLRYGQKIKDCFPVGDFFVDLDEPAASQRESIERLLRIIFDDPFVTPTRDEYGMFHAEAASWRSSDLSRQVGAAVCDQEGNILAVGCNEVPKSGGGLYWPGDDGDGRDFQRGKNEGNERKRLALMQVFDRLESDDAFKGATKRLEELKIKVQEGESDLVLDGLQSLDAIEYGRTVHAEMAALSDAALRGVPVNGSVMYVNTFPCHLCARHLIAAGIQRVMYVEPYPKSLTSTLFGDSVSIDPAYRDSRKVSFEAFTGVAPRLYRFAFNNHGKRKDKTGEPARHRKSRATTKMKRYVASYIAMERNAIQLLKRLKAIGEDDGERTGQKN